MLKKCDHENIIRVISYGLNGSLRFQDGSAISDFVWVIMEYNPGRSLFSLIEFYPLNEQQAKQIFRQLLNVLKYLSERNICHRHITLENILIDEDLNIKLIDFGFATKIIKGRKLDEYCGTPIYMSPELENHQEYYGQKIDIFASGVILFTLIKGYFPF